MQLQVSRAVGYRRVSLREQVDGHSLDAQEIHIRNFVAAQGWELVEIYTDAGISAKKGSRRPALEELLKDAKGGKFDVVVVDKIDRFYRHLGGLLAALDQLNVCGVTFASVQEKLDFTTPWGKLMLTVLGMLAEIYLDNLRQETRKGKRQRAREGLWMGGVPYGYCNGLCSRCVDPNGEGYCPDYGGRDKSDGKILVAHPIYGSVVRLVFEWYASGEYSYGLIADKLNGYLFPLSGGEKIQVRQRGGMGRTGPRPFTRDLIRDLIQRAAYIGKLLYQERGDKGKEVKRRYPGELMDGKQPALVDEDLFQKAQQVRISMSHSPRVIRGRATRVYLLSGILLCGYCGGRMRGVSTAGRRYYQDATRYERLKPCEQPMLRANHIEEQVIAFIKEVVQSSEGVKVIEVLQAQYQMVEQRFERAKDLYLQGEITREHLDGERNRLEIAKRDLHIDRLGATMTLSQVIRSQLADWDALSQLNKKRLLRLVLEAAWARENALVALQPTVAFLPLLQEKSCNYGAGGNRTHKGV